MLRIHVSHYPNKRVRLKGSLGSQHGTDHHAMIAVVITNGDSAPRSFMVVNLDPSAVSYKEKVVVAVLILVWDKLSDGDVFRYSDLKRGVVRKVE